MFIVMSLPSLPFTIVHMDQELIVINKPPSIPVSNFLSFHLKLSSLFPPLLFMLFTPFHHFFFSTLMVCFHSSSPLPSPTLFPLPSPSSSSSSLSFLLSYSTSHSSSLSSSPAPPPPPAPPPLPPPPYYFPLL